MAKAKAKAAAKTTVAIHAYRIVFYLDHACEWRWSLHQRNGRCIADSGEGYKRIQSAKAAIFRFMDYLIRNPEYDRKLLLDMEVRNDMPAGPNGPANPSEDESWRVGQVEPRQSCAEPRQSCAEPRQSCAEPRQSCAEPCQPEADPPALVEPVLAMAPDQEREPLVGGQDVDAQPTTAPPAPDAKQCPDDCRCNECNNARDVDLQ